MHFAWLWPRARLSPAGPGRGARAEAVVTAIEVT